MDETRRFTDRGRSVPERVAVVAIVVVALTTGSWSLSADKPVRVASRETPETSDGVGRLHTEPWAFFPGRTGYWSVNLDAAAQHRVVGQWLQLADAMILTPGWSKVARDDTRDQRSSLGLSVSNFARLSGSVVMEVRATESETEDHNFETTVTASEAVLALRNQVDWHSVGEALAKDRLNETIRGLVGTALSSEVAEQWIAEDLIAGFFEQQSDPLRLLVSNSEDDEVAELPPAIPGLWDEYQGELATFIVQLPLMDEPSEDRMQQLIYELHQSAEFYLVAIDNAENPQDLRIRLGLTPRGNGSPEKLAEFMQSALQTGIESAEERDEWSILFVLNENQPEIRSPSSPSLPSMVVIEVDVPASEIWRMYTE